jgi:hypothetical protein
VRNTGHRKKQAARHPSMFYMFHAKIDFKCAYELSESYCWPPPHQRQHSLCRKSYLHALHSGANLISPGHLSRRASLNLQSKTFPSNCHFGLFFCVWLGRNQCVFPVRRDGLELLSFTDSPCSSIVERFPQVEIVVPHVLQGI